MVTWLATTPASWATLAVTAITVATIAVVKHTKSEFNILKLIV